MRYMQMDSSLWWSDTTDEDENYNDDYQPSNNGRIRPCVYEWGDYIIEEQEHYVAAVGSGEIKLRTYKQHRHSPEEISIILAKCPKLMEQGMTMMVACTYLGITPQTYYRWIGEYKNIDFVEKAGNIRTGVGEQY